MNLMEAAKGKKILLLDGFCKQCLPFLRSFKEMGCEVTIACNSLLDSGYASRLPNHKVLGHCDWKDPQKASDFILNLIKTGNYDIVYPLFDKTVELLSHHKMELSKYANIYVNDKEIFDAAFNKNEVMRVCMKNGIPCPKTLLNVSSIEDVENSNLSFPLIIKPHSMYGARGFHKFENAEELKNYITAKKINIADYVVQEFLPEGSDVLCTNIFIDRYGEIKSCYSYICEHVYPEAGGTSTLNGILDREDIKRDCEKLVKLMHLRGVVGVDLMIDKRDSIGKVIEINVRPPHAVSIGFFFGVDNAQQVIEDALELPVTNMEINRTDTAVRITQTDVLWFLASPNRFKRSPKNLGYRHVIDQMFFWEDPLPWFAFLLDGMKNYHKKMLEKTQ